MRYKYTYKQIAKEINRTVSGIKSMRKNNPRILDLVVKGLLYEESLKPQHTKPSAG